VKLEALYAEIAERSDEIARAHASWPCLRGCNGCCRNLAGLPAFTRAEWEHLWVAYRALPEALRARIRSRVERLDPGAPGPCPFLDEASGQCRVYSHRPAICRTYGFYAARDGGRWCEDVDGDLERRTEPVTFGDQDAVDDRLAAMGDPISILEWFTETRD
jgi:Fe-S-cluster containining protein